MPRKDPETLKKRAADAELRQERLAQALRANLRRRKAAKTPRPGASEKPAEAKD